ncbi:OLC1v1007854C1 [Oldenlandia corymbosa var. corymbosa]|uniref:OLC1v1007854C1 n=1 Tax=Oldenlandia corymbosa var. corymbosa TaxID=529605 RepID=A0AAV1DMN7_OLDCO|nr:OLC1v1007854C1 [Oldenlandia corymbosa var. corymbosa]
MAASSSSSKVSLKLLIDTKNQRVLFAEAGKNVVDFLFHILTLPMSTVIRLLTKQKTVGINEALDLLKTSLSFNTVLTTVFLKKVTTGKCSTTSNSAFSQLRYVKNGGSTSKISLKLLVDTKSKRVLFAEAGKDAVDFLFHILTLPMGTVIRLLTEEKMVGCIGNLYESIENLCETYIQANQTRKSFSNQFPRTVASGGAVEAEGGYVKGVVTYMVMDDLVVKPMSTISSIALLNKFNVKEVGALEEKAVDLGINEALKLLKTLLSSKTVLSSNNSLLAYLFYGSWAKFFIIKVLCNWPVAYHGLQKDHYHQFGLESKESKPCSSPPPHEELNIFVLNYQKITCIFYLFHFIFDSGICKRQNDCKVVWTNCGCLMSSKMTYFSSPATNNPTATGGNAVAEAGEGGFVKGVLVTYMVMDDLEVKPMSTISSIALLINFNVKEVGALQEKVVDLGLNETSLSSKTVLTTVFLKKGVPWASDFIAS